MFVAVSRMIMPKLTDDMRKMQNTVLTARTYLNTSAGFPYLPCKTSGAKYSLSPSRSPIVAGQTDAIPKSPIFRRPSRVMKTFPGLRSRWMTPPSWMNLRPYTMHTSGKHGGRRARSRLTLLRSTMIFHTRASSRREKTRPYSHRNRSRLPSSHSSV
jgi:hypothetical protein